MKDYKSFRAYIREIADINNSIGVLAWDREVFLPERGARFRAQQQATLSAIAHKQFTKKKLKKSIKYLLQNNNLSEEERINVKRIREDYKKMTRFSEDFVKRSSLAISNAYTAWIKARKENDFNVYKDALAAVIKNKKEEARILGFKDHPYDALLDHYEPGMNTKKLDRIFSSLRKELLEITSKIAAVDQIDNSFFKQFFPKDNQWKFSIRTLKDIGYDFEKGRQDLSEHPFTINFSPEDVRITTRVDEWDYSFMFWSSIHEGGHALYEMGLPVEQYGMPLGSAASLSIHESQSRLYENQVARSFPYWQYYHPILKNTFEKQFRDVGLDTFYKGMNRVAPNCIRTEADELHYHLHVMIRYEIEKGIMEDKYDIDELPDVWNGLYAEYLKMKVPDDNNGILQDIHWAHGSLGYFPTYTLGSLYAAQFFSHASKAIGNLDEQMRKGQFDDLLNWLRSNIHVKGRKHYSNDLCKEVCGEQLDPSYFINYARAKFGEIYGIDLGK